jgi:hypothetical protein
MNVHDHLVKRLRTETAEYREGAYDCECDMANGGTGYDWWTGQSRLYIEGYQDHLDYIEGLIERSMENRYN